MWTTLTRTLQIPTSCKLFRFRTERDEVQHFCVSYTPFEVCLTLERHTTTSEVTVWLELSDLDFVQPTLYKAREHVIQALVQRLRDASLTHDRQSMFKGHMDARACVQMAHYLEHILTCSTKDFPLPPTALHEEREKHAKASIM